MINKRVDIVILIPVSICVQFRGWDLGVRGWLY